MSLIKNIDNTRIPEHIAIIMDGNGRWAKQQNLDRSDGHREGVNAVRKVLEAAGNIGVKYLTLYTFSTENWNRPEEEVKALMDLMIYALKKEADDLMAKNVRLLAIGDLDRLPKSTRRYLDEVMELTANNTRITLVLALSYSSRWEIVNACKKYAQKVISEEIEIDSLTEESFSSYLETRDIPDPDFLIRSGGEVRISNFLLWQTAYAELYFSDVYWPDFDEESLYAAIIDYQKRERRYGKISEQIN